MRVRIEAGDPAPGIAHDALRWLGPLEHDEVAWLPADVAPAREAATSPRHVGRLPGPGRVRRGRRRLGRAGGRRAGRGGRATARRSTRSTTAGPTSPATPGPLAGVVRARLPHRCDRRRRSAQHRLGRRRRAPGRPEPHLGRGARAAHRLGASRGRPGAAPGRRRASRGVLARALGVPPCGARAQRGDRARSGARSRRVATRAASPSSTRSRSRSRASRPTAPYDAYRCGKSLRKAGFDSASFLADLASATVPPSRGAARRVGGDRCRQPARDRRRPDAGRPPPLGLRRPSAVPP